MILYLLHIYRFRESGISSVVRCLRFTAHWVWPASRCGADSWSPWSRPAGVASVAEVAAEDEASSRHSPSPAPSSSDDGGFLPRVRAPLRPSAAPPFRASSPALALSWPPWPAWPPWAAAWAPWSPLHVSDLSSVPLPSADSSLVRVVGVRGGRSRPAGRHARHPSQPPPHEASPESRSSSSGFGSKNASSQAAAGSVAEWRPPPYRAPPPPPGDAGSVDVHYEWDRSATPSTPERPRARPPPGDVEARVRAMKQEFLQFRQRQALRRRSPDPAPLTSPLTTPLTTPLAAHLASPAETVC